MISHTRAITLPTIREPHYTAIHPLQRDVLILDGLDGLAIDVSVQREGRGAAGGVACDGGHTDTDPDVQEGEDGNG
jgi:hypothetical protein